MRRARLRLRPVAVAPGELATALGGSDVLTGLLGIVLASLPSVASFDRSLETLSVTERTELLQVADRVRAHVFDLLGSGATDLGPTIDWSRDFKTGRRWPLDHI